MNVLSLETCLKLKEAGWEQNLEGWHYFDGDSTPYYSFDPMTTGMRECCYAPSLEELLEAVRTDKRVSRVRLYTDVEFCNAEAELVDGTTIGSSGSPSEAVAALLLKLRVAA